MTTIQVQDEVRVFRALADPTRRQILEDLRQGELAAGENAGRFAMAAPSVSRHLRILREAGLVSERRQANRILYTLCDERLALCLGRFLSAVCPEQIVLRRTTWKDGAPRETTGRATGKLRTAAPRQHRRTAAAGQWRLFPGEHERARFAVTETADRLEVAFAARDGSTQVDVAVEVVPELTGSRLFRDLDEASAFFRCGATGWSATSSGVRLDGMLLETCDWRVEACRTLHAESSYFAALPPGGAELDCALVMRNVAATWKPLPAMARAAA